MIVHISLYYLQRPEDAGQVEAALRKVPEENPAVVTSWVGRNLPGPPPMPGMPDFADVAQVITFASEADAAAYPQSAAHLNLKEATGHLIKRVSAADFFQE